MRLYISFILLISVGLKSFAGSESVDDTEAGQLLSGYEPSYFALAKSGDELHLEFKISLKYPLSQDFAWLSEKLGGSNPVYFAYTGKYDFFLFSEDVAGRESAPVVSRIQNPGIFVKHEFDTEPNDRVKTGLKSISVGWFHESNGQQISDNATFASTLNGTDYVSRGWDYLAVDARYRDNDFMFFNGYVNLYSRLRFFCNCQGFGSISGREDDISILGDPGSADIRDYDGLRFILDNFANSRTRYELKVRTGLGGEDPLENWSFRTEISHRVANIELLKDIPFTLFYFSGYGENISTYHRRNEYIGFGFKMW